MIDRTILPYSKLLIISNSKFELNWQPQGKAIPFARSQLRDNAGW
jgi:hypothetical protein